MDILKQIFDLIIRILVFIKNGAVLIGTGFHGLMLQVFSVDYHWLAYVVDLILLGGIIFGIVKGVKSDGAKQKIALLSLVGIILLCLAVGCLQG